jgi:hypothetical protein
MKKIALVVLLLISYYSSAQSGGGIHPSVIRKDPQRKGSCYDQPLLDSVQITAYIPGTTDTLRGVTDSPGDFYLKPVPAGIYTVKASLLGYMPAELKGVIVSEMKYTYICIELTPVELPAKKKKRKGV